MTLETTAAYAAIILELKHAKDRIEQLQAALREIDEACNWTRADETCRRIARAALGEKKDE